MFIYKISFKKVIAILLCICMLNSIVPGFDFVIQNVYAAGSGTIGDPLIGATVTEMEITPASAPAITEYHEYVKVKYQEPSSAGSVEQFFKFTIPLSYNKPTCHINFSPVGKSIYW